LYTNLGRCVLIVIKTTLLSESQVY